MLWGMWEKVKTVGELAKTWGSKKSMRGVILRGLLQRGIPYDVIKHLFRDHPCSIIL